jgi:flagellar biosynthesis protein FlhF
MRLKSFFADTIEEAIQQAHREMGPEAMLVNSKTSAPEARHLGAFEVVCAADNQSDSEETHFPSFRLKEPPAVPPVDRLSHEVSELKQQMERLALALARTGSGMAGIASDPELSKIFATLTEAELDADMAYDVVAHVGTPATNEALRAVIGRMVRTDHELGGGSCPRTVALVGPPGSGKTTTLVKLAARYGIASRRPTQILSLDTYRIGAADELRSYASILGIGFQIIETKVALAQALEEHRQKDLVLIDTPGLDRNEKDWFCDLASLLASCPGIDTHLVLPASMRTSDLKRTVEQYEVLKPSKLLFTRLDETETFGPILNLSVRIGKPVSFLSLGQRIPEDLEAATTERILDLVLKRQTIEQSKYGTVAA